MIDQKKVFKYILIFLSLSLIVLPFVVSFNDVLTKILQNLNLYVWIQNNIVPIESRMMGVILMMLGYKYAYSPVNALISVNDTIMQITWNCIGWQSMFLYIVSLLVGIGKRFTKQSILITITIGIIGTFWINIFRMLFTITLQIKAPNIFRVVFHDYLAALVTIFWLFFFWWFSYKYILESK